MGARPPAARTAAERRPAEPAQVAPTGSARVVVRRMPSPARIRTAPPTVRGGRPRPHPRCLGCRSPAHAGRTEVLRRQMPRRLWRTRLKPCDLGERGCTDRETRGSRGVGLAEDGGFRALTFCRVPTEFSWLGSRVIRKRTPILIERGGHPSARAVLRTRALASARRANSLPMLRGEGVERHEQRNKPAARWLVSQ